MPLINKHNDKPGPCCIMLILIILFFLLVLIFAPTILVFRNKKASFLCKTLISLANLPLIIISFTCIKYYFKCAQDASLTFPYSEGFLFMGIIYWFILIIIAYLPK